VKPCAAGFRAQVDRPGILQGKEARRMSTSYEDEVGSPATDDRAIDPMQEPLLGTMWATSWGYDQTNVEFFQVIRETAKTVWVREIAQEAREGRVWPVPGAFIAASDDDRSWRYEDRRLEGNRCLKKAGYRGEIVLRIDDIRYAYRYRGGGKYETFAAGGMGH
jgi:hypothetical protein